MAIGRSKVVIIGAGNVGTALAHHLVICNTCNNLVLINRNAEKARAEVTDLNHSVGYYDSNIQISVGTYSDCIDADIVVLAVGVPYTEGMTRLDMLENAATVVASITRAVMDSGFHGIFLVITNPVDAMTYLVKSISGLPDSKVMGTGTALDSARLRYFLADLIGVDARSLEAMCMGEHGDSSFVPWDHAYLGCKKIKDIMKDNNHPMDDLKKIHQGVINAAYEIIDKKKSTYYGIGMALSRIVKAVLENENAILTVSTYLKDGDYGQDDIYIGVPAIINSQGVRELLYLELNKDEQAKLDNSCKIIKQMREENIENLIK